MSVLNFPQLGNTIKFGQITPSFWHHGAHPSSTPFQSHAYPPLPQSQIFIIFLQFIFKTSMVLLIFKIHCLIATAFKEKALKIVILQILSAF